METQPYNQRLIVRYLLDDLPEEERLRFEDDYLSDHRLFEMMQAVEEEMIEDYVNDRLSEPDRAQFKRHYIETATSDRREKVEFARALIAAARVETPKPAPSWRAGLAHPRIPILSIGSALAAILLLVAASWLFVERSRLRQRLDLAHTEIARREQELQLRARELQRQVAEQGADNDRLTRELEDTQKQLARLRAESATSPQSSSQLATIVFPPPTLGTGSGAEQVLIIRPGVNSVRLVCRFHSDVFESSRAVVRPAAGGDAIWDQPGLKLRNIAPGRKAVVVNLPAYLFTATKDYTLTLSDTAPTGTPDKIDYRFRVVKQ